MADMLKKKREGLEMLLHEMESLRAAVREGRFDGLDELAMSSNAVIKTINSLDREYEEAHESARYSRNEVAGLKRLVKQIGEITDDIAAILKSKASEIQDELGALRRGAEAAQEYRRQANVKV